MSNHINNPFYKALELKYAAEVEDAKAKITLYFSNPQGVADHSGITEELDKYSTRKYFFIFFIFKYFWFFGTNRLLSLVYITNYVP